MERPDKTMYFLKIALAVSARSTCLRRKFGAVIVKGNTIVGTGYNGPAKGVVNCMEVGCIKNVLELPRGRAYDYCPAVHAEENAIINSNRVDRIGAKLYLAGLDSNGKYTEAIPNEVIVLNSKGEPDTYPVKSWINEDSDWYINLIKDAKS